MPHVLLLGAGFSRNWNGWLANEIGDALLEHVADDQYLQQKLNQHRAFEDALASLQAEASSTQGKERLAKLEDAILSVFGQMNQSYSNIGRLDFPSSRGFSVEAFLSGFDAIFTLNQDLLLERAYKIPAPSNWAGYQFPGMIQPNALFDEWRYGAECKITKSAQPIFKLHGSVNWRSRDGGHLLIMGGNKVGLIKESELLTWYMDCFRFYLSAPRTRLMVIGYGFMDNHINDEIVSAAQNRGLATFLVDIEGRDALADKSMRNAVIRTRRDIENIPLIGVSKRELRHSFGDDALEHGKFGRFFGSSPA